MTPPRVAAINDMSGYGRCSLTVALPILSVMGIQCCPLPTAYLSTHTGGFEGYTFFDMTDGLMPSFEHWQNLNIKFDAVFSGFLGSEAQLSIISDIFDSLKQTDTLILVDPVMADNGEIYTTYTQRMCRDMVRLSEKADIITPNPTEAAIFLDLPLDAEPGSKDEAKDWLRGLNLDGKRSVVLTGLSYGDGTLGAASFDAKNGKISFSSCKRVPCEFPGTGDIFASVLLGAVICGKELCEAADIAVRFVHDCMELTYRNGGDAREGVYFEPLLKTLTEKNI